MDINIETLTRNLSEYSMEANNASIAISKGLQPVGIAILIIFFLCRAFKLEKPFK